MSATLPAPLAVLAEIAAEAGRIVLSHYEAGATPRFKEDRSPVTDADEEAEALILARLAEAFPGVPVVAEEQMAAGARVAVSEHFFLVDPLDGTREFLSRNGEFTVNIAEVRNGTVVAGVVQAPAKNRTFVGGRGLGAFEGDAALNGFRPIAARVAPPSLVAVGSRSHMDARTEEFLRRFSIGKHVAAGSSLKFCLVAAGEADIYARAGRTMEWDTAAGQGVLEGAGGRVTDWEDLPFRYGKRGFENGPFAARGR